MLEERRTELVQAAVGKLHLRLDPEGAGEAPALGAAGQVAKQRALPCAGLTTQDDDTALAGKRLCQDLVERCTFLDTAEKLRTLCTGDPAHVDLPGHRCDSLRTPVSRRCANPSRFVRMGSPPTEEATCLNIDSRQLRSESSSPRPNAATPTRAGSSSRPSYRPSAASRADSGAAMSSTASSFRRASPGCSSRRDDTTRS